MSQHSYSISEDARIEISRCSNRVTVVGWDDSQRVEADYTARQDGDTLFFENASKLTLRVPRTTSIVIDDCKADLRLEDVAGRIELRKISGDVNVHNVRGELTLEDVSGDLLARDFGVINGRGIWKGDLDLRGGRFVELDAVKGDVSLANLDMLKLGTLGGDLNARMIRESMRVDEIEGAVRLREIEGRVTMTRIGGDLIASDVQSSIEMPNIEGDAVLSITRIAEMKLRAHGDMVIHLPEDAHADLVLSAPRGDLITRADIQTTEEKENQLMGTMGGGGASISVESTHGDVILGGGKPMHREHQAYGADLGRLGRRIAADVKHSIRASVRQTLRESLGDMRRSKERAKLRAEIRLHRGEHHREHVAHAEPSETKPHGPAAGSPERQAILDAIARGEMNVDEAIRKLTGEEV